MKLALIGLGMVAPTHLAALRDGAGVSLCGVLGRDPARVRTRLDELGHDARVYADLAELLADRDLDGAVLATPPNVRARFVQALAEAGKPVLMEKPIERDLGRAQQIVNAMGHVPWGVVFQHRVREASRALRDIVRSGKLGDLAVVDIRVPWWRDQSYYDAPGRGTYAQDGGGVLITQAIHTLDLALWIAGPVTRVQAMARRTRLHDMEAEDLVSAGLEFANGAIGTVVASTAHYPGGAESITLQGTRGAAHLEAGVLELNWRDGTSESIGDMAATGGGADPMAFTHGWHQAVLEDFAQAVTEYRPPLASGPNALAAQGLIDAMIDSSRRECIVEVPNV